MVTSPLSCEAFSTFREPAFTAPVVVISPAPASRPLPVSLPSAVISPFAFTLPRLSTVTLPSIVVSFLTSSRLIPAVRLLVAAMSFALAWMLSALVWILPESSISFALRSVISPLFLVIFSSSSVSLFVRAVTSAARFSLVLFSCLPVTASVELSFKAASFRFVIVVPPVPARVILSFTAVSYFTPLPSSVVIFPSSSVSFALRSPMAILLASILPSAVVSRVLKAVSAFVRAVSSAVILFWSSVFAFVTAALRSVTSCAMASWIAWFLLVTSPLIAVLIAPSRSFLSCAIAAVIAVSLAVASAAILSTTSVVFA